MHFGSVERRCDVIWPFDFETLLGRRLGLNEIKNFFEIQFKPFKATVAGLKVAADHRVRELYRDPHSGQNGSNMVL